MTDEKHEAMQAVVDRVSSYQDGATEATTEKELREGFAEAGLDVDDHDVSRLVAAIEQDPASVDVAAILA